MNRVIIVAGGRLGDWVLPFILPNDLLIGADSGALFLLNHQLRPHIAVGDFDSLTLEEADHIRENCGQFVSFDPIMKDYTDSELAFRMALESKPTEILFFGAIGTRYDHSLANVHLLLRALQQNVPCKIMDEWNEIQLTDSRVQVSDPAQRFRYVSLLPLTEQVHGITLDGFLYPLNNATLTMGQSLAVSNELIADNGTVEVKSGKLLVIQSRD